MYADFFLSIVYASLSGVAIVGVPFVTGVIAVSLSAIPWIDSYIKPPKWVVIPWLAVVGVGTVSVAMFINIKFFSSNYLRNYLVNNIVYIGRPQANPDTKQADPVRINDAT